MSTITQPKLSEARAARIAAIEDLTLDLRLVLWALAEEADELDERAKEFETVAADAIGRPYHELTPTQMADYMVYREYQGRARQAKAAFEQACKVAEEGELR